MGHLTPEFTGVGLEFVGELKSLKGGNCLKTTCRCIKRYNVSGISIII